MLVGGYVNPSAGGCPRGTQLARPWRLVALHSAKHYTFASFGGGSSSHRVPPQAGEYGTATTRKSNRMHNCLANYRHLFLFAFLPFRKSNRIRNCLANSLCGRCLRRTVPKGSDSQRAWRSTTTRLGFLANRKLDENRMRATLAGKLCKLCKASKLSVLCCRVCDYHVVLSPIDPRKGLLHRVSLIHDQPFSTQTWSNRCCHRSSRRNKENSLSLVPRGHHGG